MVLEVHANIVINLSEIECPFCEATQYEDGKEFTYGTHMYNTLASGQHTENIKCQVCGEEFTAKVTGIDSIPILTC